MVSMPPLLIRSIIDWFLINPYHFKIIVVMKIIGLKINKGIAIRLILLLIKNEIVFFRINK